MNAIIKKETTPLDTPQATQAAEQAKSNGVHLTEAERKKTEDKKRINAFIDKHESLLIKLAK